MHREQEIANLAEEFSRFRKNKKRVKYPQGLWSKAANLCERHPYQKVAHLLGIHKNSLRRHLHSVKKIDNPPNFIPIQIAQSQPLIQIHLKSPVPITIEFSRSTEELAKLLMIIQEGVSC
jgi:hypothetical protein